MQGVSFKHHSEGKGRLKRDPKKRVRFHQHHSSLPLCFSLVLWGWWIFDTAQLWNLKTSQEFQDLPPCFIFCCEKPIQVTANTSNLYWTVTHFVHTLHRRHFSPKMLRLTQNSFAVYQKATVTLAGWRHARAFTAILWHSHSIPIKYLSTYLFPLFGKYFYVEQSWSFKHPINV